jgi:triosephosphate isomerase
MNIGLLPVLCVGESREEYDFGLNHEVCAVQLIKVHLHALLHVLMY